MSKHKKYSIKEAMCELIVALIIAAGLIVCWLSFLSLSLGDKYGG